MADKKELRNIAIVGASGNVGSSLLQHLLQTPDRFRITIISRSESTATFPSSPSIIVKKGSLADSAFLEEAFQGHDAVLFALSFFAQSQQNSMIEAAAKAGVKWIIPNEYANDGMNVEMTEAVPVFKQKLEARQHIEELSKTYEGLKWIGVTTNPFFEMCFQRNLFGINASERTATFYPDAGAFNVSTMSTVGLGIARLLSLPINHPEDPRASLQHYANNFVYLSSFCPTQTQLLKAVQRVTGTSDGDWKVDQSKTLKKGMEESREAMKKGDFRAGFGLTFAYYMGEGLGGNYEDKAQEDRRVLGLPEEDFEAAVKSAVEDVKFHPM